MSPTVLLTEKGTDSSLSLRDSILEKSRMSFRMERSDSAEARTVVRWSTWFESSSVSNTSSVMPMMPFIGVRISWLILARNSLLARLAAMAVSRAVTRFLLVDRSSAVRASTVRSSCSWCLIS